MGKKCIYRPGINMNGVYSLFFSSKLLTSGFPLPLYLKNKWILSGVIFFLRLPTGGGEGVTKPCETLFNPAWPITAVHLPWLPWKATLYPDLKPLCLTRHVERKKMSKVELKYFLSNVSSFFNVNLYAWK